MSRTVAAFEVAGLPAPQGSKTVGRSKGGGNFVREDNPATAPWRNAVTAAAREAMAGREPFAGPAWLDVEFVFNRPRAHLRQGKHAGEIKATAPTWHTSRPDTDKLLRAIGDALTGTVVVDDAQFAVISTEKRYGAPCARIVVTEL